MKSSFLLFLSVALSGIVHSQSTSGFIARVGYSFLHARDTNSLSKYYQEDMLLFINKNESIYKSLTWEQSDSIFKAQFDQAIKENANGPINIGKISLKGSREVMITDFKENTLSVIKPFKGINYAVRSSIDAIKWNIKDSTKLISGYLCQLAICNYKGRNYKAWFCTGLPISGGPWKLHGLPGLVVEANDEKMQVIFRFQSFQNASTTDIKVPSDLVFTTEMAYQKMRKAYSEQNNSPDQGPEGVSLSVKKSDNGGTPVKKKLTINNPVELTDK